MARRDGADGTGDLMGEGRRGINVRKGMEMESNKYEEENGKRRRGINMRKRLQ